MKISGTFISAFFTLLFLLPAAGADRKNGIDWSGVRVVTEDLAPLGYIDNHDGRLKGPSAERVVGALRRLDAGLKVEVLPWARALNTAENQKNVFIFNLARTPEREKKYKCVCHMADKRIGVFALADRSDIVIRKSEDIGKYRIVMVNRNISHLILLSKGFDPAKTAGFFPVSGEETAVKMLYNGRADIWIRTYANGHDIDENVRREGFDPSRMRRVADMDGMNVNLYLAASLSTSDVMVEAMRRAMGE